jgi:penicillin-binding protein 2
MGDLVGRQGIEREFEEVLRGTPGRRWVEVDALGRERKVLKEESYGPGQNLVLTLDASLQEKAEALMGDRAGALIALDPRNGEVLAMVSQPRFDPNVFAKGVSARAWKELASNGLHPLEDRTTRGQYPPGSVFKIVMAGAALEEGALKKGEKLFCPGQFTHKGRTYRDWKPEGHGWVDLHRALVESCDVFFYQVGLRLGIDTIAKYARAFGLGEPTGLGPPGEKAGIVPSSEWKRKTLGEPWYPGETVSASIGQGYTVMTPIQMAVLISAVANGGTLYRPRLVLRVEEPEGGVVRTFGPEVKGRLPIRPEHLETIRRALRGVVNEERGTAFRARIQNIPMAGKTGTAQVVRMKKRQDQKEQAAGPRELRDHGWFVAFAPYEDPRIAVVVLGEHGGQGGSRYAPLVRDLIAHYLDGASPRVVGEVRSPVAQRRP